MVFSKFDMKSGFWQIQISENDRYKTAFTTPFGHYEWNVMSFGLKNAPSEFQNIMNDIFNSFSHFTIVYIVDVLVYSSSIDEHWKHLYSFLDTIKEMVLLSLLRKSNCLKKKFVSLAMTSLKDIFVLLIELFNLLISFLILSLIKHNSKDLLGH